MQRASDPRVLCEFSCCSFTGSQSYDTITTTLSSKVPARIGKSHSQYLHASILCSSPLYFHTIDGRCVICRRTCTGKQEGGGLGLEDFNRYAMHTARQPLNLWSTPRLPAAAPYYTQGAYLSPFVRRSPADFRISQLRFAKSRLRFACVSPGVVCGSDRGSGLY